MPVCLDANVIISWLVPQQQHPNVYERMDQWLEDGVEMVGPSLLFSEVVSVLRNQVARGNLAEEDAQRLLRVFFRLGIRRIDNFTLFGRAYELATRLGHPQAYDAHYLAAAEQESCQFWTLDRPLYQSAMGSLLFVKYAGATP